MIRLGETELPLFMVKKQVFEWIKNRQKHIEIRKGKPMRLGISNRIVINGVCFSLMARAFRALTLHRLF